MSEERNAEGLTRAQQDTVNEVGGRLMLLQERLNQGVADADDIRRELPVLLQTVLDTCGQEYVDLMLMSGWCQVFGTGVGEA